MLREFEFPNAKAIRESKFRTRFLAVARTAVLSRKAPMLPQGAAWLIAAAWVAGVGFVVSLALVAVLGVTVQDVWGTSLLVWLAAHQATVITPDGIVSLLPIGLAVIPLLLWRRASRWLGSQYSSGPRLRRRAVLASLSAYVAICTAGAVSLRSNDVRASVLATIIGSALLALLGMLWGLRKQSPDRLRLPNALAGWAAAMIWFLAVGSAVLTLAVVSSLSNIGAVRQALADDFVSQLGTLAVEAAYLPNLIVWAAAYATGAGIAVGGDQPISMFTSEELLLPDLPILAAIPSEAPPWAVVLPIVILVGGWLSAAVAQRQAPVDGLRRRLTRAAFLAGLVLLSWVAAVIVSGGSLGEGRLDYIGPAPATPFVAAALIGLGATMWALLPTLASDAKPVTAALRGHYERRIGGSGDSASAAADHEVSSESRVGSAFR